MALVTSARRQASVLGVPLRLGPPLVLATLLAFLVILPQPWHQLSTSQAYRLVDLEVYRDAGLSLLHHRPVYGYLTPWPENLPFTYPPTSALLAVPLALLPRLVVQVGWVLGCYLLLFALVVVSFRSLLKRIGPDRAALALPAIFVVMSYLMPVRSVVHFGQVGLLLAVMCVADCITPDSRLRWPRGVLVGLATAMKLTPAVFIPYLWLSGRRKAAYTAASAFVGFVAVTWLIIPAASTKYWTDALFSSDRLGDNTNTSNQALRGFMLRTGLAHPTGSAVWLLLAAAIGGIGLWRASRASRGGFELAGVAITGLLAVLLSPVAWIHHLVWIVLAIGVLVGRGRSVRGWAAAVAVTLVFSFSVPWWGDHLIFRHIPKVSISYLVPGADEWVQVPQNGVGLLPVGTEFRTLTRTHGYQPLVPETRNYLPACAALMERDCVSPKHPGSVVWPWRVVQSAFTVLAVGLVFLLPIRRPEEDPSEYVEMASVDE